jgi:DNA-directed RNA polymerase specialized sigma24 family protein
MTTPEERVGLTADEEFTWFFRSEYPSVVRTLTVILQDREQARDVAQEAFIQLMRHWDRVSHYERPEAWVRRVAIRLGMRGRHRDILRRAKERLGGIPQELPGTTGVPAAMDLLTAVRRLPPAQRAAVALFYYEDQPVSEVAAILGCTPSTARVHLHAARERLGRLLGEVPTDAG